MYAAFLKRSIDFVLAFFALIILSPVLLLLTVFGAVAMKGNPFFTQLRPGRDEKIFRLIKFRTMTMERDKSGALLEDEKRLTRYGRFLRASSLDELPELFNILKGDMAIVGPRPLAIEYLPYYTETERKRHSVRPGLTGLAQINGRNLLTWEQKFDYDLQYVSKITFLNDLKIIAQTVKKVFTHEGIGQAEEAPVSLHILRQNQRIGEEVYR